MINISLTTPTLLFSAISLLFLAYTNRFLALAKTIRELHSQYKKRDNKEILKKQLESLNKRIYLIRRMQLFGVISFSFCVVSMMFVFFNYNDTAVIFFGGSLIFLLASLLVALKEIFVSADALALEMSDIAIKEDFFIPKLIHRTKKFLRKKG